MTDILLAADKFVGHPYEVDEGIEITIKRDSFIKGASWYKNSIWHCINELPEFNISGNTPLIISSCYGHIEGEAHSYTRDSWMEHTYRNEKRDFKWAYEDDLV